MGKAARKGHGIKPAQALGRALLVAAARDAAEDQVQWGLANGAADVRSAILEVFESADAWVGLGAQASKGVRNQARRTSAAP